MTGFGAGGHPCGSGRVLIELRTVNHRFVDVRTRAPRELADLGTFVEQLCRDHVARGRIDVSLRAEGIAVGAPTLDRERARAAYRSLAELRDEIAPGAEVPLSLLGVVPDLFVPADISSAEELREATRAAFHLAVAELDTMREREGAALAKDLAERLGTVAHLVVDVREREPEVREAHRRRLQARAERWKKDLDLPVDGARLEQELLLFADRSDLAEELTRLDVHGKEVGLLLVTSGPVGRKLDFLLQEMSREVNTIGSKAQDAAIAHAIVAMKTEIERMREQAQNVE